MCVCAHACMTLSSVLIFTVGHDSKTVCVNVCVYLQSPSNQHFYTGYRMSVGDHRVA